MTTTEEYSKEMSILEELAAAYRIVPEGEYLAQIIDHEWRTTIHRGTPYASVKLSLMKMPKSTTIHLMVSAFGQNTQPLISWALHNLKDKQVRIRVRHKQYDDRTFAEALLLGVDEP